MEAFSDGVLAVIITIMVLDMKPPHATGIAALWPTAPVFFSYVLSFVYIGIYWNNHHHLLHAIDRVNGATLWANLHLLFWLSLIPFTTAWLGENHLAPWPVALYGIVLCLAGFAYYILTIVLIRAQAGGSPLEEAVGRDKKTLISLVVYVCSIPLAFLQPWIACAGYIFVAIFWLIPDRRIENRIAAG
ncbi:MAG TPA: TMEM175 family protein [Acidobacteriaceae bacterium]|nr:TMEM175 family protein [Acidobacteriaceae bacterium]